MSLNARVIKLGRLFMVAWLAFYLYPIAVILSGPFSPEGKALALALLLASGSVWIWFWTRILAGPDQRFRAVAVALHALFIGSSTLMPPPKYGTVMVCVAVMAGAAFRWRLAVPLIAIVALSGGILDVIRGVSPLQASGEVLNDAIVWLAREQLAGLGVGEERLRFARDLHDLLGHSLSVIALKSELAGRLIKSAPGLAAHEVEDIETVARQALREVREAVAGYRQPTLAAELAGANEALAAAGIEYHVDQDHTPLPPAVEAVLAWTVREGVTNVMRHSQATRCAIRIINVDRHATVEVVDDGRGGVPEAGSGLRGLQERVVERGGTLTAESLPHEGFRLRVTLPLPEVAIPVDRVTA